MVHVDAAAIIALEEAMISSDGQPQMESGQTEQQAMQVEGQPAGTHAGVEADLHANIGTDHQAALPADQQGTLHAQPSGSPDGKDTQSAGVEPVRHTAARASISSESFERWINRDEHISSVKRVLMPSTTRPLMKRVSTHMKKKNEKTPQMTEESQKLGWGTHLGVVVDCASLINSIFQAGGHQQVSVPRVLVVLHILDSWSRSHQGRCEHVRFSSPDTLYFCRYSRQKRVQLRRTKS